MSTEKQPETLDAILADFHSFAMRAATVDHRDIHPEAVLLLCDKIKAAVARERNAHTNDIHDALYMATGIPGNAAAMRAALEWVAEFVELGVDDDLGADGQNLAAAAERARAALAAPARNCDRFATAEEAMEEWDKYPQGRYKGCRVCPHGDASMVSPSHLTLAEWLFATAEGGDHA